MLFRSFRYRLAPTPEQEKTFEQFAGVCRLVYNLAWEQRRDFWRKFRTQTGKHISYFSQARELTALRAEFDWIAAVPNACQQQALRDLDKAYQSFFAGRSAYPKPRRRGVSDTFRFMGREVETKQLNKKWSAVRLPKIGWVKFRRTRSILGAIKNVTILRDAMGWNASFACAIDHEMREPLPLIVGIDRGVANTLTLSTGEHLSLPASLNALDRRKRKAQRALARKKRGSNRRTKALQRVSKLSAKIARVRKDWHHKAALDLSRRFGAVIMEDLKITNMTASGRGKRGLNRSILNQGWNVFENILAYKLEERGGTLVKVDPAYTSQTCSDCGVIDKESRESQASFRCRHCGFAAHADHNAAINILRRNTSGLRVEEHHFCSDEARTGGGSPAENRVAEAA